MADRRRAFESVSKERYEPERREVPGKRPTLASGGVHLARWVGVLSRNANRNIARLTCLRWRRCDKQRNRISYPLFYNLPSMFRGCQQLLQILLPDCGPGVRTMTVSLIGDGN